MLTRLSAEPLGPVSRPDVASSCRFDVLLPGRYWSTQDFRRQGTSQPRRHKFGSNKLPVLGTETELEQQLVAVEVEHRTTRALPQLTVPPPPPKLRGGAVAPARQHERLHGSNNRGVAARTGLYQVLAAAPPPLPRHATRWSSMKTLYTELMDALNGISISRLECAVAEARSVDATHWQELEHAELRLHVLKSNREELSKAVTAIDIKDIDRVLSDARAVGIKTDSEASGDQKWEIFAAVESRLQALRNLLDDLHVMERGFAIPQLKSVLRQADSLGVGCWSKVKEIKWRQSKLDSLEEQLRLALKSASLVELERALKRAIASGMSERAVDPFGSMFQVLRECIERLHSVSDNVVKQIPNPETLACTVTSREVLEMAIRICEQLQAVLNGADWSRQHADVLTNIADLLARSYVKDELAQGASIQAGDALSLAPSSNQFGLSASSSLDTALHGAASQIIDALSDASSPSHCEASISSSPDAAIHGAASQIIDAISDASSLSHFGASMSSSPDAAIHGTTSQIIDALFLTPSPSNDEVSMSSSPDVATHGAVSHVIHAMPRVLSPSTCDASSSARPDTALCNAMNQIIDAFPFAPSPSDCELASSADPDVVIHCATDQILDTCSRELLTSSQEVCCTASPEIASHRNSNQLIDGAALSPFSGNCKASSSASPTAATHGATDLSAPPLIEHGMENRLDVHSIGNSPIDRAASRAPNDVLSVNLSLIDSDVSRSTNLDTGIYDTTRQIIDAAAPLLNNREASDLASPDMPMDSAINHEVDILRPATTSPSNCEVSSAQSADAVDVDARQIVATCSINAVAGSDNCSPSISVARLAASEIMSSALDKMSQDVSMLTFGAEGHAVQRWDSASPESILTGPSKQHVGPLDSSSVINEWAGSMSSAYASGAGEPEAQQFTAPSLLSHGLRHASSNASPLSDTAFSSIGGGALARAVVYDASHAALIQQLPSCTGETIETVSDADAAAANHDPIGAGGSTPSNRMARRGSGDATHSNPRSDACMAAAAAGEAVDGAVVAAMRTYMTGRSHTGVGSALPGVSEVESYTREDGSHMAGLLAPAYTDNSYFSISEDRHRTAAFEVSQAFASQAVYPVHFRQDMSLAATTEVVGSLFSTDLALLPQLPAAAPSAERDIVARNSLPSHVHPQISAASSVANGISNSSADAVAAADVVAGALAPIVDDRLSAAPTTEPEPSPSNAQASQAFSWRSTAGTSFA